MGGLTGVSIETVETGDWKRRLPGAGSAGKLQRVVMPVCVCLFRGGEVDWKVRVPAWRGDEEITDS